jgi:hypothetical protein
VTAKSAGKRAHSFARFGGVSPNGHVYPSVLLLLRQRRDAAGNGLGTGLSSTIKYVRRTGKPAPSSPTSLHLKEPQAPPLRSGR